jgi:hypothetical protein
MYTVTKLRRVFNGEPVTVEDKVDIEAAAMAVLTPYEVAALHFYSEGFTPAVVQKLITITSKYANIDPNDIPPEVVKKALAKLVAELNRGEE